MPLNPKPLNPQTLNPKPLNPKPHGHFAAFSGCADEWVDESGTELVPWLRNLPDTVDLQAELAFYRAYVTEARKIGGPVAASELPQSEQEAADFLKAKRVILSDLPRIQSPFNLRLETLTLNPKP